MIRSGVATRVTAPAISLAAMYLRSRSLMAGTTGRCPWLRLVLFRFGLFHGFVEELEQRLGGRIVGLAEVRVDLVMGGFLGAEDRGGNARVFQHVAQTLRLRVVSGFSATCRIRNGGIPLSLATCVTAEKSLCFAGSLPNFSR